MLCDLISTYILANHQGLDTCFATERFQRKRSKFLTLIARSVGGILCETNEHWRSEMTSNRQTHTHTRTDPSTVTLAAHARRGLIMYC